MNVNVLVVVDPQVDFHDGSLGTEEARKSVPKIVAKIKECGDEGWPVFVTKDTHAENTYLESNEGKHLPVLHTVFGTPGWKTVPEIEEALNPYEVYEIIKYTFGCKDLSWHIRETLKNQYNVIIEGTGKGLRITMVGWCTDICVIANAVLLKANLPEAEIFVDSECCAGVTPELHEAALKVMSSLQINII